MTRFPALVVMAAVAAPLTGPISSSIAAEYTGNQIVLTDHSMRTSKLLGSQVYDDRGQKIGSVIEVLVNDRNTEPMVVLSVGDYVGNGQKMVAVPLSHIDLARAQPMMAGATKQMLASMQVYLFPPNMNSNG